MESIFIQSKGQTLEQLAAAREVGFLGWVAANHSNPAARAEAGTLLANLPTAPAALVAEVDAKVAALDTQIAEYERAIRERYNPAARSMIKHQSALRQERKSLLAAIGR